MAEQMVFFAGLVPGDTVASSLKDAKTGMIGKMCGALGDLACVVACLAVLAGLVSGAFIIGHLAVFGLEGIGEVLAYFKWLAAVFQAPAMPG